MSPYPPLFHIVLHQPEIPPNTGNVGRSCVALGAKLWLVRPLGYDLSEKSLRRAGLDYWPHLNWEVVDDWPTLTQRLAQPFAAGRVWFFSAKARRSYLEVEYRPGDVLVFGCETKGLPAEILATNPDRTLLIPIRPAVRGINLSVAVGVGAFEAVRQIESGGARRPE